MQPLRLLDLGQLLRGQLPGVVEVLRWIDSPAVLVAQIVDVDAPWTNPPIQPNDSSPASDVVSPIPVATCPRMMTGCPCDSHGGRWLLMQGTAGASP